jgi:hypothetical protein
MNLPPSHEELRVMLPAPALEILEGPDLERVLAHLQECVECARLLREYREVAAALGSRELIGRSSQQTGGWGGWWRPVLRGCC